MKDNKGETVSLNEKHTLIFNNEPKIEYKTDLPDLIFIDEVTNYKAFELDLINRVVKKVICLSSDKAVYQINAMGISIAMMEKVLP
jgi:hypothetical protein